MIKCRNYATGFPLFPLNKRRFLCCVFRTVETLQWKLYYCVFPVELMMRWMQEDSHTQRMKTGIFRTRIFPLLTIIHGIIVSEFGSPDDNRAGDYCYFHMTDIRGQWQELIRNVIIARAIMFLPFLLFEWNCSNKGNSIRGCGCGRSWTEGNVEIYQKL